MEEFGVAKQSELQVVVDEIYTNVDIASENAEKSYQALYRLDTFLLECDSVLKDKSADKPDEPDTLLNRLKVIAKALNYVNVKNTEILTNLNRLI